MLCGEDASVQEHEADDEPEHPLGLAHQPRLSPHTPVPPVQGGDIKTGFGYFENTDPMMGAKLKSKAHLQNMFFFGCFEPFFAQFGFKIFIKC
jgi:hypothetical protein